MLKEDLDFYTHTTSTRGFLGKMFLGFIRICVVHVSSNLFEGYFRVQQYLNQMQRGLNLQLSKLRGSSIGGSRKDRV